MKSNPDQRPGGERLLADAAAGGGRWTGDVGLHQNLKRFVSPGHGCIRYLIAGAAGILLSCSLPPMEWSWLAWIAVMPMLLMPRPVYGLRAWTLGWTFGFAHFVTCLAWLNEVGFAAGVLLAVICAFFPAGWYVMTVAAGRWFYRRGLRTVVPHTMLPPVRERPGVRQHRFGVDGLLVVVIIPALWVGVEWIRSWFMTGFPWNLIGVSQWEQLWLLSMTRYTGVYGISFVVISVNVAVAMTLKQLFFSPDSAGARRWVALFAAAAFVAVPAGVYLLQPDGSPAATYLNAGVVQGKIPQNPVYREEQFDIALDVYDRYTRRFVGTSLDLDFVVWPETPVPAAVRYNREYYNVVQQLIRDTELPLLAGSIDYQRDEPEQQYVESETADNTATSSVRVYNSVFLFDAKGRIRDQYRKIHLVPFGEYIPFEKLWPWLNEVIGMGRSLTAGQEYTIFRLKPGVHAGVNICYEDVFASISRNFVKQGANLLVTVTNDAWYGRSAGPRQHMIHAVFRAVENARPLLRVGNNSYSCVVLPDGRVSSVLLNPETQSPFFRGAQAYFVPVPAETAETTWYTRYGDVFAIGCFLLTLMVISGVLVDAFQRKAKALAVVQQCTYLEPKLRS